MRVLLVVGLVLGVVVAGVVGAVLVTSYVDRGRFADDLADTRLPAYLPDLDGFELDFVADPDPDPLTDEPQLSLWYVDDAGDQIVVHVRRPGADPCAFVSDCRTVDGVTTGFQGDGGYATVGVVRDDALLAVTEQHPGALVDPDAVAAALASAGRVSYDDLAKERL